jgi:hypothetical protein
LDFTHEKIRLGKQPYKRDERTLQLAKFFNAEEIRVPTAFDFDAGRKPFPNRMWGNDEFGDCVIAAEANGELRLERVEAWNTINMQDADAVDRYKLLTGCKEAGDENDTGLEILMAMRDWRKNGFTTTYKDRNYKIDAYGELDISDIAQLRMATYILHGIHFGIQLPVAAQTMTNQSKWDYTGQTGNAWTPGSWGGHCVYAKKFTAKSIFVKTWGMEIEITNAFIERYADEAWGVVDSLDAWRKSSHFNVALLEQELAQITSKVDK